MDYKQLLTHTDCLMRQLTSADGDAFPVPPGHRVAAFDGGGQLIHLWLSGTIPLRTWLSDALTVLLIQTQPCRMPFALMELLPCRVPPHGAVQYLGLCGEMHIQAGNAISLYHLWSRRPWGADRVTFGDAYCIIRSELSALWRTAADELRDGAVWRYEDWQPAVHRLPDLIREPMATYLFPLGLTVPAESIRIACMAAPTVQE